MSEARGATRLSSNSNRGPVDFTCSLRFLLRPYRICQDASRFFAKHLCSCCCNYEQSHRQRYRDRSYRGMSHFEQDTKSLQPLALRLDIERPERSILLKRNANSTFPQQAQLSKDDTRHHSSRHCPNICFAYPSLPSCTVILSAALTKS